MTLINCCSSEFSDQKTPHHVKRLHADIWAPSQISFPSTSPLAFLPFWVVNPKPSPLEGLMQKTPPDSPSIQTVKNTTQIRLSMCYCTSRSYFPDQFPNPSNSHLFPNKEVCQSVCMYNVGSRHKTFWIREIDSWLLTAKCWSQSPNPMEQYDSQMLSEHEVYLCTKGETPKLRLRSLYRSCWYTYPSSSPEREELHINQISLQGG